MAQVPLRFPDRCSSWISTVSVGIVAVSAGGLMQNAGLLAFGAVLIAGPAVVLVLLRRSLRGIHLHRDAPASAFEGEPVEVALEIENSSTLPIFFPEVSEVFAPEIHTQKDLLFAGRLQPGEKMTKRYEGYCLLPRGAYTIGPTAVRVTDPFGWFDLRKFFGSRNPIKIYPSIHDVRVKERVGSSLANVCENITRNSKGESTEFLSVREYRTGDSPRRIHWGLTAHRGFPVVREFSRITSGNLCVILDLHPKALIGFGRNSSLEHAVKITASISADALRRGRRVAVIGGSKSKNFVPDGSGTGHLQGILDLLVTLRPTEDELPLPKALGTVLPRIPSGATLVVMVSPYVSMNEDLEGWLAQWRGRGHRVIAVLFDQATFPHLRDFAADNPRSPGTQECARRLQNQGAETYIVPCGADLEMIFRGGGP